MLTLLFDGIAYGMLLFVLAPMTTPSRLRLLPPEGEAAAPWERPGGGPRA